MADHYARIANHPLRQAAAGLLAAVDGLGNEARRAANETEPLLTVDRAAATAEWVVGLLDIMDPLLVGPAALDPMVSPLEQAAAHVAELATDVGQVGNVAAHLDQVLVQSAALNLATPAVRQTASSVAKGFGISLGHRARALRDEIENGEQALVDLRTEINQARATASQQDDDRVAALHAKLDALQATADQQQARVDQLITNGLSEHAEAQKTRDREYQQAERDRSEAASTLLRRLETDARERDQKLQSALTDAIGKLDTDTAEAIERIDARRKKVEELYEVFFKTGTAGGFAREAEDERRAADTWRWIAVTFGVLAIVAASYSAFVTHAFDTSWPHLIAKLAVTIGLGTVAAYSGKQSSRHRHREETAKQLELDLTAIGPFIEEFPEGDNGKRDEVRRAFVDRWFASRKEPALNGSDNVVGLPVKDIVEALVKQLNK